MGSLFPVGPLRYILESVLLSVCSTLSPSSQIFPSSFQYLPTLAFVICAHIYPFIGTCRLFLSHILAFFHYFVQDVCSYKRLFCGTPVPSIHIS